MPPCPLTPVILAAVALAALLAPAAPTEDLDRLIQQLGARSWHEREAAAEALLRRGQDAVAALQRAREHPDPEVRHRARALLDQLRWSPPSGLPPFLAAALKHYPDLPDDRRAHVLTQVANAAQERAVPLLRQALRHDPSPTVRARALERLERLDRDEAERELRALAAEGPLRAWAATALGDLLASANRLDEAIAAYQAARKAGADSAHLLSALASLRERQGDWRHAIPLYQRLTEIEPQNTQHRLRLGWCHYRLGHGEKAFQAWHALLDHRGHDRQVFLLLAHTYQQAGAEDKALAVLREGCGQHAQDFELRRSLAHALMQAGHTEKAIEAYTQAVALAPTDYQRHTANTELGRALRHAGRLEEYVQREERELERLDRRIACLMEALARRALEAGDRGRARELFQRLVELYPESEEAARAAETLRQLEGDAKR